MRYSGLFSNGGKANEGKRNWRSSRCSDGFFYTYSSSRVTCSSIKMLTVCPPEKRMKIEWNKRTNANRDPEKRNPHFNLTVEVKREDEARLQRLRTRLDHAKMVPRIDRKTSSTQNADLLEQLLNYFELVKSSVVSSGSSPAASTISTPSQLDPVPPTPSSTSHKSHSHRRPRKRQIYVDATVDDPCFVCTGESLKSLVKYFTCNSHCEFCGENYKFSALSMSKQGHVCRLEVPCVCGDSVVWLSSGLLGHPAKYVANVRMVHAFTSTGLTETQYHSLGEAAGIGSVMDKTIDTIYRDQGFAYISIVRDLAQKSMADARRGVQATPHYITNGDCIITDARHDSSRAAMHSTVSAISMSNQKIIAVCNWSRADERSAPSREVPMTKQLITDLTENKGYNVGEVAHDCVMALKNWFEGRGIKNSFDTWHGTKGVARDMKKICSGPRREEGVKWFTELSDKAKATKTHFYWAMRNNDGTAAGFQQYLLNIVDHYQDNHALCHQDSRCKQEGYVCSKKKITDPKAVQAYTTAIAKTTIYKNPTDYLLNENVSREVHSIQYYQHSRHPGRMAPTRVLRPKTFEFRQAIWRALFQKNKIAAAPLPV